MISMNKLFSVENYWSTDNYIGCCDQIKIQRNIAQYPFILFNKVRSLIDHFNDAFQNPIANTSNQSIDKYMIEFKGRWML